jgi:hypothetical protein
MNKKQVYEYAVLRIVPKVEKEEFINVGVIMYCRHLKYIGILTCLHEHKLLALDPLIDLEQLSAYLAAIKTIAAGNPKKTNTIEGAAMHERFRWITANRSTMLQSSKLHTGLTEDAHITLQILFEKYVQ